MTTTQQLVRYLSQRSFYSIAISKVLTDLGITRANLAFLIGTADVQINVFEYNGVEYVGLESRRLDYVRDAAHGTNAVKYAIDRGVYGPPTTRNEDIRRRGGSTKVVDHSGRVVPLMQATVWTDQRDRYVPPPRAATRTSCAVL